MTKAADLLSPPSLLNIVTETHLMVQKKYRSNKKNQCGCVAETSEEQARKLLLDISMVNPSIVLMYRSIPAQY